MNPFRADTPHDRSPEPATIVVFGASGDLTQRKLIPAIYNLLADRHLSRVAIVGTGRTPMSDEAFKDLALVGINTHSRQRPADEHVWATLSRSIHYHAGSYDDPADFVRLGQRLDAIEAHHHLPKNRLFYLSTPPSAFAPIIRNLGAAGLVPPDESPFSRVIIEKPFGTDLPSAVALNRDVHEVLRESQIFRIDHYLGKETVQNLLVFRFANGIFEPLWNNKYIDHVQITGAETLGVEGRGAYFDHAGIMRDMVQNHLFQVLCLAALEPPSSLRANAVRDEKLKVLEALRPITSDDIEARVVRGRYRAGSVLGAAVPGYLDEPGVAEDSATETYVAMKLFIDNWRWGGVPFYLRSAKRMPKRVTEIAIHFKNVPHRLFAGFELGDEASVRTNASHTNVLAIRIQPDEGISMSIGSKVPGQALEIAPVTMEFRYASSFGVENPEAYERLLLDALTGDGTLFTRGDEVEASWRFITPIHDAWRSGLGAIHDYEAGSWGPEAAADLLARDGRRWRRP